MEAPFNSKRTLVCTNRSRMASAAVVFPFITSYQFATGNCETMMVAFCPCLLTSSLFQNMFVSA